MNWMPSPRRAAFKRSHEDQAGPAIGFLRGEEFGEPGWVYRTRREFAAEMRNDPGLKAMICGDLDPWGPDRVDASTVTVVVRYNARTPADGRSGANSIGA
jgi:hypothetical protein